MKRTKALVLSAALCLSALPLAAQTTSTSYVALDSRAVSRYFSKIALNISCSYGTHLNGSHAGLTEHFNHYGPLGWCGILSGASGDYHIIRVTYYMSAGGNSIPDDPKYNGTDPRATGWQDVGSGKKRQVTGWEDRDRDGRVSPGDLVSYADGATAPVEKTGTAAEVERSVAR